MKTENMCTGARALENTHSAREACCSSRTQNAGLSLQRRGIGIQGPGQLKTVLQDRPWELKVLYQ